MKRSFVVVLTIWQAMTNPLLAEQPVVFRDEVLKAAVENELRIDDPTPSDMLGLTNLTHNQTFSTQHEGILKLDGLEYAAHLRYLDLRLNRIQNITPLQNLTGLTSLNLSQNDVTSLSPLAGLTGLTYLNLHGNHVTNLSPLSGLTRIQTLVLRINDISNLSPLGSLTEIRSLDLYANEISDVSVLAGLSKLTMLNLNNNSIRSINSLAGMNSLIQLYLRYNRVSNILPLVHFPALQKVDLTSNKVSDVSPLVTAASLTNINLAENPLNENAYCTDLAAVLAINPDLSIHYDPNPRPPEDAHATQDQQANSVHISWAPVCNGPRYSTYYRICRSLPGNAAREPVSGWQRETTFNDHTGEPGVRYYYWIQASSSGSGADATDFSDPTAGSYGSNSVYLMVSSTTGGYVSQPHAGECLFSRGQSVNIEAVSNDPNLFAFTGWTGTAVDAGKVADPFSASTTLNMDDDYTLHARFVSLASHIFVAPSANDATTSGEGSASKVPEFGTASNPLHRIQDAIDVAGEQATILVQAGRYVENLILSGKSLRLLGYDPEEIGPRDYPIIDGNNAGPVLCLDQSEDPNCLVRGFVITGGLGSGGTAIKCTHSRPTIVNCLIFGNHAADRTDSTIYCYSARPCFINCTIADNHAGHEGAIICLINSSAIFSNSIIWNNTPSHFNIQGESDLAVTCTDLQDGSFRDGNLNCDPLFIDANNRDYHLQSQAGRWNGCEWITDAQTSPCIDAGDPFTDVGMEGIPNGSVINMGAYGGTCQASLSPE